MYRLILTLYRARIVALALLCGLLAVPAFGQGRGAANDLVRRVIQNEDKSSAARDRYIYKERQEKPQGTLVKQLIETDDGLVARILLANDKPLTPQQRAADEKKLNRLLKDPDEQRQRRKEQKQAEERSRTMVKALPDAFLFDHDGNEVIQGVPTVRLKFVPNPDFDPPIRETMVFRGMKGFLWVEPKQERLVKMDAELFEDVTFGWGILGKLYRGGRFVVEQSRIEGTRWETTRLEVDFTGKALLFKTIKIKQKETLYDFRRVPPRLTLAQGIELLRKSEDALAVQQGGSNGRAR